jgi:uncharacterized protein (TIGR00297 family)
MFWATAALLGGIPIAFGDITAFAESMTSLSGRLGPGLALSTMMAALAWRVGVVTSGGATAGGLVALLLYLGFGPDAWLLLGLGLATTAAATRLGHARKLAAGLAEARGGRRAAGNIVANTGVAGAAAIVTLGSHLDMYAALAASAAIVTAVSDTVATEAGQVWGRHPRLVTSLRRVQPGTPGAASWPGVAAGAASALLLSGAAVRLGLVAGEGLVIVATCAVAASLFEGALAVVVEPRGWLDNDGVNLVNAMVGAGLAIGGMAWFAPVQ